ncbi:hypothetical protein ACFVVA_38005 [Kitasatospora sp. NPDC058048]|uniref:hypothetical protein n=1 Tax=Kitasatospora sp. NPDC058048 TaxID=3346313 RepID=UPI0036D90F1B
MEGEGGLQQRDGPGQAGDVDLGAQDGGADGDVAVVGAGVADQAGDLEVQAGRALVERFQVLAGEVDLLAGPVRVGEGGVGLSGMGRHGRYFERGHLILDDGDADVWADTAAWFLDLLPADARAVAMIESNPDSVRTIPAGADAAQVREILQSLFGIG